MTTYLADAQSQYIKYNGFMDYVEAGYDPNSIKKYPFSSEPIPRLRADDPEVDRLIKDHKPVVVTDSGLVQSALKWDLKYLEQNLGNGLNYVFESKTNIFKYFNEKRLPQWPGFEKPTVRHEVRFSEFIAMLGRAKQSGSKRVYLQQTLNDTVGKNIVTDFIRFRWEWVTKYQKMCGWDSLTSNLLLIGMEDNITPVHYDEQENFFAQIGGYKRCILFPPSQFECLYPHPVSHPCDRQSQVDFNNPDYSRFPKFCSAKANEAIVGPGDVLYIPTYWWHHIESIRSMQSQPISPSQFAPYSQVPVTISVNFWYKAAPIPTVVQHPLQDHQLVSVMRNVEKMLGEVLGNPSDVGNLLCTIVQGRYDDKLFRENIFSNS